MLKLEELCRQAFGAYQYLRDHELGTVSGTSKRLRSGNPNLLRLRLAEELEELKGVIEGTHFHEGFEKDIILEGYEVWYWAATLAAALNFSFEDIQPARALESGFTLPAVQRQQGLSGFLTLIKRIKEPSNRKETLSQVRQALSLVGMACSLNQTSPTLLLARDIKEMQQKDYLKDYWESPENVIISQEGASL